MKKTFRRVALCTALVCATFAAASCSDGRQSEKADGDGSDKSELTDKDGELAKMAEGNWIYKDELTDASTTPTAQPTAERLSNEPTFNKTGKTRI